MPLGNHMPLLIYGASKFSSAALGLDNSANSSSIATPASLSVTLSVSAFTIIVAVIAQGTASTAYTNTLTDSAGLTWHKRSSNAIGSGAVLSTQEVWWAACFSAQSLTVTSTFAAGNKPGVASMTVLSVKGCKSGSQPWDINGSIPTGGMYTNLSTPATFSSTSFGSGLSTTDPNTFAILNRSIYSNTVAQTAGTPSTVVQNQFSNNNIGLLTTSQVFSTVQSSLTLTAGGANSFWIASWDALAG